MQKSSDHIVSGGVYLGICLLVGVSISSIGCVDGDFMGCTMVFVLAVDVIHLLVEGWATMLYLSVELDIDGKAHQSGANSLMEEADEKLSSDESGDHD